MAEERDGVRRELRILRSEEDKTGTDISRMTDFMAAYASGPALDVRTVGTADFAGDVPAADLSVIASAIAAGKAMLGEAHSYVADFPSLPADVRAGLGSGTYHLGASRQVQGNLRPVVVDEHGVRVKDVTLRKACGGPGAWGALAGVALQIQVRQLSEKLDEIQTWQKYQVACDRNRALYDPFRTARESIYQAQLCGDEGERREHLLYAEKELGRALSSACSDIETTSLSLAAATERSFFLRKRRIGDFMGILSEDLRFASQITGLRLLTLDYLGKTSDAGLALNTYQMSLKRLSAGATSSTPRGTAPGLPRPARSSSRRPRGAAGTPMWRAPGSRSPAAMPPSPARATTP